MTTNVKKHHLAEKLGHCDEQLELGIAYFNGDGVSKSYANAKDYFFEVAKQCHGEIGRRAQFFLGILFENGYGVNQDWIEAHK